MAREQWEAEAKWDPASERHEFELLGVSGIPSGSVAMAAPEWLSTLRSASLETSSLGVRRGPWV